MNDSPQAARQSAQRDSSVFAVDASLAHTLEQIADVAVLVCTHGVVRAVGQRVTDWLGYPSTVFQDRPLDDVDEWTPPGDSAPFRNRGVDVATAFRVQLMDALGVARHFTVRTTTVDDIQCIALSSGESTRTQEFLEIAVSSLAIARKAAHELNNLLTALHCQWDFTSEYVPTDHPAAETLAEMKTLLEQATEQVRRISRAAADSTAR